MLFGVKGLEYIVKSVIVGLIIVFRNQKRV